MKSIIYFVILVLISNLSSCDIGTDFLDPEIKSGYSEEEVFSNPKYAMLFLNDIYGRLIPVIPQTGNRGMRWRDSDAMLEVTTDNGSTNLPMIGMFYAFNAGQWSASSPTLFSTFDWRDSWESIRASLIFLKYIDQVPLDSEYNFTEEIKAIRKGEAIFLMAFNYAEMLKQFGGLPLIQKIYNISDDFNEPRATFDETVDFIVKLCEEAASLLPLEHELTDFGRATKGAALALKSRLYLYAASRLWNNPDKPEDSPFRGKYDPSKWERAAKAAKEVMDLDFYQLHGDISTLFLTRSNTEFIFTRMNQPTAYMTSISIPNKLYPPGTFGKSGCNQVTYNMIKEYEILKEGKAYMIDNPESGYDPNDPYKNRDPRFYRDCMFNGYHFQGKTVQLGEAVPGAKQPAHNPHETSAFYTHVYSVKFADKSLVIDFDARAPRKGVAQNYPYIRYAEVLMNYAEAMNEAFGPEEDVFGNGKTALWAVNQVRKRSIYPLKREYMRYTGGMPEIESGLSQNELREKIRHERRVEFAFEEHRFWDVRRWMLPAESMTKIEAQIPVWQLDGTVKYEIRTIENRYFDPSKMYRMPIPEEQIFANPKLIQNPGYSFSPESSE